MFVLANLIIALTKVIDIVLTIMYWLILVRALVSWVNPDPFNPIIQFLHKATEPILAPLRRILPFSFRFGIDVSPILVFLIIIFLRSFLVNTLMEFALRLK